MIDVSNNNMNGSIPTEIGQLMLLHTLNLSGNNFSGNIPTQISNLKNLEALDLSRNALSGNIPSSLASLHFLHNLNVSYNDLRGPIPTSTQLQSLNASAFEGNPKLCGAPVPMTMSVGQSRALMQQIRRTTTMWTVVTNFHGFIFLLC
ncbi:receptor-like protein 2 [Prunus yedoensis var. nudiflora]|uniref:Receptor-like protein 2 n=1 Tax=Prunus yedoensis var. nudiflora TaxID=2094558 RepID=A0A314YEU5_PRUYE|nr:receptor-like protein 2 [Prunus yedoensis var. nudiflora]